MRGYLELAKQESFRLLISVDSFELMSHWGL